MRTRIVSFGKGAWYPRGLARLRASLVGLYDGEVQLYTDEAELGCLTHKQAPYAFKVAAIRRAQADGVDVVVWLDASVWAIKPLAPLLADVVARGHTFFHNGWSCGQWTNDRMLQYFGMSRDEAMTISSIAAGYMGLDLRSTTVRQWLNEWEAAVPYFPGHWDNKHGTESADTRCLGHRHDQAAASIVGHRLGMEIIVGHTTFVANAPRPGETVADSVCLLAQGML